MQVQLYGTNVRTCDFLRRHKNAASILTWNFQDHPRIRSLELDPVCIPHCVSHITVLPKIPHLMNVRDYTGSAFVTSSRPLRNILCHFVYRPQNVWPADARQQKAWNSVGTVRAGAWTNGHRGCRVWVPEAQMKSDFVWYQMRKVGQMGSNTRHCCAFFLRRRKCACQWCTHCHDDSCTVLQAVCPPQRSLQVGVGSHGDS